MMCYFDDMKENKRMQSEPGRGLKGESNHALKEFVVGSGTSTQWSTIARCFSRSYPCVWQKPGEERKL